ncbi:oxaloacetate decarboxylase [Candidatus Latescibacteria bacterium]|jgi:2,3-dimethylmalate lyase|nr:oxaloacetate decarboxylase [Candidatus Latescibacterota bacterium]
MKTIQRILDQHGALALPGLFDALSALIAQKAGCPMGFVSGYSVAATALGEPDLGLLTQTEIVAQARRICKSVSIPVLIDADTGYGNALNTYRTVNELIDTGAAGCFLEDQVWPKRCGHMRDKRVVERGEYLERIRAAVEARGEHDFFIVARSDAEAVIGLDEAIDRVSAAHALGADACFVEAPGSVEQLAEIGRRTPGPRVANMIEGGKTPLLPKQQLAELGFQLILYPLTGLFGAAAAMHQLCTKLMTDGTSAGAEDQLMDFASFNELIGVEERLELVRRLQEVEE